MGKDLVSQRESAKIFTRNTDPLLAYPKMFRMHKNQIKTCDDVVLL